MQAIEKRIRKDLRINQKINTKSEYRLLKGPNYELTKHFLEKIFKKHLILNNKKTSIPISCENLDSQADEFIDSFLNNSKSEVLTIIKPLRHVLNSEIVELCKILKIDFKLVEKNTIANELEKSYPGTKFSIMKSYEFVEKKIK